MKIVLTRPNYNTHGITPPLALGYLSSYLQTHGSIKVKIIDGMHGNDTVESLSGKIIAERPDAVGITCLTAFYKEVVDLSNLLKKKGIRVIVGGVHPTFLPKKTLVDSNCDFIILGEGEISFLKLVQNNFNNQGITGVYSLNDIERGVTPLLKSEIIRNLDDLPFPDWEQMDPRIYPKAPHGAIVKNFPIGIIQTTRGCPYACTFCSSPKFSDRRIRFRSAENVLKEIQYLQEHFGVKEIHFEDDNFTVRRRHAESVCNLIIEKGIKISWACPNGIRADKVDRPLIKLMKKSGCYYFAFGIESVNPRVLEIIKKGEDIETITKSIKIAHEEGISTQGFFIFGLPGETPETIEENIQFAERSKLARAQFLILDVLPGSELWDTLKDKFTPNWEKNSYKEPEWIPDGLTKEQLMDAQARAFRGFYFKSPMRFLRLALTIRPEQIKFLFKRLFDYRIIKQHLK